ncbi:uncharacterized protein [Rutidosis leptorrhynchoides]|uniref:uncharacterized protein n=1 Tax=Rutidosis leptorrhynchoides TaxID=125765 RepID=UPI003A99FF0F
MKIISLNIRGFGVDGKLDWAKELCRKEKPNFMAFQETKCHNLSDFWVQNLWGSSDFGFIQKDAIGNSGGLLLIWDTNFFEATEATGDEFFLAVRGKWKPSGIESIIVNVYGPHCDPGKIRFWESLEKLLNSVDSTWALCGDFNEVRYQAERLNCVFYASRAKRFNEFIDRNQLVEIPLGGKMFTRTSDDGLKFSKLDRFLVSDSFVHIWEDLSVVALDRKQSDHCPLLLRDKIIDFGPKPFKVFDVWFKCEGINTVVTEAWNKGVFGLRKDCILRDKMKNVKVALKAWSYVNFGKLDKEIDDLKTEALE